MLLPFLSFFFLFFFFNDTATTEIYTLSLHDALPIFIDRHRVALERLGGRRDRSLEHLHGVAPDSDLIDDLGPDRKSTRLNSSHSQISYAVFCLKKKKN